MPTTMFPRRPLNCSRIERWTATSRSPASLALGGCRFSSLTSAEKLYRQALQIGEPHRQLERLKLLREATDAGHVPAINSLAVSLVRDPLQQDEAYRLFERAAAQDSAAAHFNLAKCLEDGVGSSIQVDKAMQHLQRAAELGFEAAQLSLADRLRSGTPPLQKDLAQARHWYNCAVEQHASVTAMCCLAEMAYFGEGGPEDDGEAARLYRLAAERGSPVAQFSLACMLQEGEGVGQDDAEAVRWLRASAAGGHAAARYALAGALQQGRGVARDPQEAAIWYAAAANQARV